MSRLLLVLSLMPQRAAVPPPNRLRRRQLSADGARLVAFAEDGAPHARGPAIGQGNRWRHQIAYGRFAAASLAVEVITPHIGGIVTFSEIESSIRPVAHDDAYTSHRIRSRELDMAVALDVDDDGLLELVIPTQDRARLVAIGLSDGRATIDWEVELPERITSNVAAGSLDGVPTIAVGTQGGHVVVWQAQ